MSIPRDNSTIPVRVKKLEERVDELSRRETVIADPAGVPRDMILLNDITVPTVQTDVGTINTVTIPAIQTDAATTKTTADTALAATTDGLPPASSPAAEVIGGLGSLFIRWPLVANANPVTYKVYVDTTTGFTPGAGNLVGQTGASSLTVRTLTAGTALAYGATYYAKIVASDADGSAAAGAEGSGSMLQVDAPDIAANAITAVKLAADAIDGKLITGATFRTAASGGRWEISPTFGNVEIRGYTGAANETDPGVLRVGSERTFLFSPNMGLGQAIVELSATGSLAGGPAISLHGEVWVGNSKAVNEADAQTLTNKTLASPTMTGPVSVNTPIKLDAAWTAFPLVNSWVANGGLTPVFYKDAAGIVHLRGRVSGGTAGLIGTLPAGYRPSILMDYGLKSNADAGSVSWVQIAASGAVTVVGNVSFAQTWLTLCLDFSTL